MRLLVSCAILALAGLCVPSAFGQESAEPLAKVYACAGIADGAQRLACYDAAVGRLKEAEATGEITALSRSEIDTIEKDAFGLAVPSLPAIVDKRAGKSPKPRLESLTVSIRSWSADSAGMITVVTEDGQVWRQIDGDKVRPRGKGPWQAEIKRAMVGSYLMKVGNLPAFRARRQE